MKVYLYTGLAVLVWGIVVVIEKAIIDKINPWALIFWHVVGAGICISILMFSSSSLRSTLTAPSTKIIVIACITGLLGGFLGVFLYFKALALGEASVIIPLTATYPVVTMLVAYVALREPITLMKFLGTALIVGGCFLISRELT
jgi:transporter family protein